MAQVDYGRIISRSWNLTWKNKWLWVYGLVLVGFFAGLSGSNFNSGSGKSKTIYNLPKNIQQDLPRKTSMVLGDATNAVRAWFSSIPMSAWRQLMISGALAIVVFVIIRWIIVAWAKGALIHGLSEADKEKPISLTNSSPTGRANTRHLIILGLISLGISLGISVAVALLVLAGSLVFSFIPILRAIWLAISIALGILGLILFALLMSMASIYAERLIVLRQFPPLKAWEKGFALSRKQFFPTIVMGLINTGIGCAVGCLSVLAVMAITAVFGIILLVPIFIHGSNSPSLGIIIGSVLLSLLIGTLDLVIRTVLTVFNFGTWNLFFQTIISEEENEKPS